MTGEGTRAVREVGRKFRRSIERVLECLHDNQALERDVCPECGVEVFDPDTHVCMRKPEEVGDGRK